MPAQLRIDQEGLDPGTPGKSRTDGLDDGSLVTLTNTGSGATTTFNLLWVPPGDTTAVSSLAVTEDPKVWTFTPTEECYGSYRIELVENEGLVTEKRERRVLVVRTPNFRLVIPALNERGAPNSSLLVADATQIETAENNAEDYDESALNEVPYAAWWRSFHELAQRVDQLGAAETKEGWHVGTIVLHQYYSTSTTDADPGAEFVRANNADLEAATELYISNESANGAADSSALFDDFATGYVRIEPFADPDGTWILYRISSVQSAGTYYRLTVQHIQTADLGTNISEEEQYVKLSFMGGGTVRQSIVGTTTQEQVDSLVAALEALGLVTDDR